LPTDEKSATKEATSAAHQTVCKKNPKNILKILFVALNGYQS
jgi:hypothetical protein